MKKYLRFAVGGRIQLLILPLVLILGIFLIPKSNQLRIALNYRNPEFYQFYTAAYVHANTSHLVSNLFGYLLAVTPLYALYAHQNRRSEFFRTFAVIILAVPIVANVASYLTWSYVFDVELLYGRGFSAVVAAFVGLLFMRVLGTFDEELPEENATYAASVAGFALFGSWAILFTGVLRLFVLLMLAVLLAVVIYASVKGRYSAEGMVEWMRGNQRLATILAVGMLVALFLIIGAFPTSLQGKGGFVNIVGHGAGFFSGMFLSQIVGE